MWVKILMKVNVFLYKLTRGAVGSKMGGQNVLLLQTVGRKTGKIYNTPTNYFQDGGSYLIVASNWGKPAHPGWYFNLMSQGTAQVQIKDQVFTARAEPVSEADYDRMWKFVTSQNPFYLRYQEKASRQIPLIRLTVSQPG